MRGLWTAIAGRFEAGEDSRGGGEYALMIELVAVVATGAALLPLTQLTGR